MYPSHRCSSGRISPSSARFPSGPLLLYAGGGRHASGGMTRSVGNSILASGPQGPQWWAKRFPDWGVKDASYSRAVPLGAGIRRSSVSPLDTPGRARGRSSPICRRVRHGQAEFLPILLPSAQRGVVPLPQLQFRTAERKAKEAPLPASTPPGREMRFGFHLRSVQSPLVEAGAEAGA